MHSTLLLVTLCVGVPGPAPAEQPDYHFVNDIVPILSRFGCNSSGCHGKAEGQNGFKLSVFGFDPVADHASLVSEGRGRRVLPAAPEASLLLRKMAGQVPHGGGARVRPGTAAYETVRGWIAAGMPMGRADAPHVVSLRMDPPELVLNMAGTRAVRVFARYSHDQEVEVTDRARFVSNNEALATVDASGQITAGEVPGEVAIMGSFLETLAICRVLVPRRERLASYPALPENNHLDRLVHDRLRKLHILPSETCDDATFLRRVHLDLLGMLPNLELTRRFLADKRPDRRSLLVEELLARPEFVDYWAMKWADLLRVDRARLGAKQARSYYRWIRQQVASNVPLDQFARQIITSEGPLDEPAGNFFKVVTKPGEMAGTLSQVFLGVRLACAECHHHPFDRWGQHDYHAMAAYFVGLRVEGSPGTEVVRVEGIAKTTHPRTGEVIFARALGQKASDKLAPGDRREELAAWMTSPSNPWFARNLANRVWAHFLGRGLVEPVDDVRDTNPATNPELLDALARHLTENRFDVRALIRLITASRVYQRATTPNSTNESDGINYSRGLLRRLPAEVMLDLICQATGVPERFQGAPPGTRAVQLWDSKVPSYFLKAFGRTERASACACERNLEPSVAQVLHLLNAPEIEEKLGHAGGRIARLVKGQPSDADLVEELYLTFFARLPDPKERTIALTHLKTSPNRQKAAEDLAWGMLNALEFLFNH